MQDSSKIGQHRLRVRVLGDMSLAPQDVQDAAEHVMRVSAERADGSATLDILFSYTSSFELAKLLACRTSSAKCPATGYVCACASSSCLQHGLLADGPPVDLLVRTSGESRLSDFLVWQSACAQLAWSPSLWPEFSFSNFIECLLSFQVSSTELAAIREALFSLHSMCVCSAFH
jgi:ditrans,polycis-polyprenyl diphosphate synthase